jgi:hypothetical protein
MANDYVQAAFIVSLTHDEAHILTEVIHAVEILDDLSEHPNRCAAAYAQFSADFQATFPPSQDNPFGSFLACFDDSNFIILDCDITIGRDDGVHYTGLFTGANLDPGTLGNILARTCKSAQPFGFEYACTSDKMRPGSVSGGYVFIANGKPHFRDCRAMLQQEIDALKHPEANGFVIA